ncbi:hypothetical protein [Bradyrhizobium sp. STM 3566]|uniref:hypothetical protein n=1 Tax=Bradyrhizobium sp. STM 3566 TaxID=578928 RepID=UPI00388D5599
MPKRGTAVATFTNRDGETFTVIIPATYYKGQLLIDAANYNTALCAIRAAGLDEVEFEFVETEAA